MVITKTKNSKSASTTLPKTLPLRSKPLSWTNPCEIRMPSFQPQFTITNRITAGLPQIEQLCPGINRRSLQRELKAMLDKGLLIAEGATNQLTYRLTI